ncbi:GNAT family N-acetyltransferase [Streptomyces oryzae]|uniref:GNAT family N-acetyltransferase n=1 Tax=Streptomyces oryzae TaxID=1434886 RepID=A0ABS3XDI7_9ACTN|nr:GNAT family N-acetyltransferase [Streptomyces oryzae]MBO8193444.1 GNAT family N-acetyltransferase [Streptomyces oryzae]
MRPDDWHLTDDIDSFLARAGDFLRSRPALHTIPLTVTEGLRTREAHPHGAEGPLLGFLERAGEVRAACFRTPPRPLNVTPLDPGESEALAARLSALGLTVPGVIADRDTAAGFAGAWQRHTGATPTLDSRRRLYRLDALATPEPRPQGRARVAGEQDREQLVGWYGDFTAAVGAGAATDATSWADTRITHGRVTFWESPHGTPVSMAGVTPMVAGQVRVAPVYTPARLRGHGYAGAVTAEVSRAALAAGAAEVVLFADLANPTSNRLYQRIGYRSVADFATYAFRAASGGT